MRPRDVLRVDDPKELARPAAVRVETMPRPELGLDRPADGEPERLVRVVP